MQSKLFFRLNREKARLTAQLGEGADVAPLLAAKFQTTEDRIRKMEQRIDARDTSLDAKAFAEGPATIMDTLRDTGMDAESVVAANEVQVAVRDRVEGVLGRLDEREQVIVRRRLLGGEKETLSDIGRELGLSRERVRQIETRARNKLRVLAKQKALNHYLN
jgi:RNA polymerase sigma-32 factor